MFGLTLLDLAVVGAYLLALVAIGVRASRRIRSEEDYLLGGRRSGKLLQTFASFGQATSADGPVGTSATTFVNGAGGIWSSLLLLFATPLFWITSPWFRRMRLVTLGDFFEERYGSRLMAAVYAVVGAVGMMGLLSLGFSAMTKTVVAMTPKPAEQHTAVEAAEVAEAVELSRLRRADLHKLSVDERRRMETLTNQAPRRNIPSIDEDRLVWLVCLFVMVYAIAGGLEAAFYTDMLQGVFIILLSLALAPCAWAKVNELYGGEGPMDALRTIHAQLPQHYFDMFGSPKSIDFTWYYVLAASIVATVTVVAQPNQMVTSAAAKDDLSARTGFVTGVFIKRGCTLLWGAFGLAAILLYTGEVENPDLIWGHASRDLLGPGFVGLMIASMMAALMSTADTLMLVCTGLLLKNVYRPLVASRDERHYVWVGRLLGAVFLAGAATLATRFGGLLQIIKFIIEFFVIFAPAFWLGVKWRRANAAGAWASIVLTLLLFYLGPLVAPLAYPSLYTDPGLTLRTRPAAVTGVYKAVERDVAARDAEIAAWDESDPAARIGARPEPLTVGERFEKTSQLPPRGVFWSGGVRTDDRGTAVGSGYLFPELVLLQSLGFELDKNRHAVNETLRLTIRLVFPFAVLAVVSLVTPPIDRGRLDAFFIKMRTNVVRGAEDDAARLAAAYADPSRLDRELLFPGTSWEIYRWNRVDAGGFFVSIGVVVVILGLLFLVVNLGG